MSRPSRLVRTLVMATTAFLEPGDAASQSPALSTPLRRSESGSAATVVSFDGVPIRYEAFGAGDPALVFIHGWSCDRSYWSAQVPVFAAGHRVVLLDLAGHGESGRGRRAWTMTAFGKDVRAVVEALHLRSVVLVGHSMGGPVALEAATLMPSSVQAVIGVDTLGHVARHRRPGQIPRALAPLRADYRGVTAGFVRSQMFTSHSDPALADRITNAMAAAPPAVAVPVLEAIYRYDAETALARVHVPIHLINAGQGLTDLAAAQRSAPQVRLTEMPDLGHFLMIEAPEAFNRVLTEVLRDLAGGQARSRP